MAGGITEKGCVAAGIASIFAASAAYGYVNMEDINSINNVTDAVMFGVHNDFLIVGGAGTLWAAGYALGKICNTVFGTQSMDDSLGKVLGYGAALLLAFSSAATLAEASESPVMKTADPAPYVQLYKPTAG